MFEFIWKVLVESVGNIIFWLVIIYIYIGVGQKMDLSYFIIVDEYCFVYKKGDIIFDYIYLIF